MVIERCYCQGQNRKCLNCDGEGQVVYRTKPELVALQRELKRDFEKFLKSLEEDHVIVGIPRRRGNHSRAHSTGGNARPSRKGNGQWAMSA